MSKIVAIDFDGHGIFVASGSNRKGQVVVERAVAVPDDGSPITNERASAIGRKLKETLKQAGIQSGPAVVLVGRDKLFLKEVKYPIVPLVDEPNVVRFQALKDLADNPDDHAIDYLPLGSTSDGGKKANVVFVKKEILNQAKLLCEAAGLKLFALTPKQFAVHSIYESAITNGTQPPESVNDAVGILYPSGPNAEFIVVRGQEVLFSRQISMNNRASKALPTETANQPDLALVNEIKRNLNVITAQVPGGITAIYVAEAGNQIALQLQEHLHTQIRSFDPLKGSPVCDSVPAHYHGRFASTAGAIRLVAGSKSPLPINFVTPRQPKAEANKSQIWALLSVLAALLVLGVGYFVGQSMINSELKKIAELEDDKKRKENEYDFIFKDVSRVRAAKEFMNQQVRLHDELYDITEMAPNVDKFRLSKIAFKINPLPNAKAREDERKRRLQANYKAGPVKPVGEFEFTIQTNDPKQAELFVDTLLKESTIYVNPKREFSQNQSASSATQSLVVKAGVLARKPTEYTRKLNVVLPKPKTNPKSDSDEEPNNSPAGAQ